MKKAPRKQKRSEPSTQRLVNELERCEEQLQDWIQVSPDHARLFRKDPVGAMRAAGLDMEDDIMLELEMVAASIAAKLHHRQ